LVRRCATSISTDRVCMCNVPKSHNFEMTMMGGAYEFANGVVNVEVRLKPGFRELVNLHLLLGRGYSDVVLE
jgi:hypothetical protein